MKSPLLLALVGIFAWTPARADMHVWEKMELTFHAKTPRINPYTNVEVWVDLKGPGFDQRCYGFWDGGEVFRVRILAPRPGRWTWRSGSNPKDAGLDNSAAALLPSHGAKPKNNPCRRDAA